MTPVRPQRRIDTVDILRGFSLLGVLLVNMLAFSGPFFYTPVHQMQPIHRAVTLFIKFFAQAKFYTLFSFLFGWGMAIQMERAEQRSARFIPVFLRRTLVLLMIGLIHAILIWEGDILTNYATLAFLLLLCRKLPNKVLLVAIVVCILTPVLLSAPIEPVENFVQAYGEAVDGLRQQMFIGFQQNVHADGSYLDVTIHRWRYLVSTNSRIIFYAPHIFGMFLLGLYVGRNRILHDIPKHLSLFRKVLWSGLIVGFICNLIFVAVENSPVLVPPEYFGLATAGARSIGGPALCLFYVSTIVLLTQRRDWYERLSPLANVGRMALTNYLTHSILLTLVFYGYGLGFYGRFGPAITIILTLVIYRIQISTSAWWLFRYRFGPAEWLWRTLTYLKIQPLKPERTRAADFQKALERSAKYTATPDKDDDKIDDARVTEITDDDAPRESGPLADWLFFIARRLAFIVAVAFAIAYFCILGVSLTINSTTSLTRSRSAMDMIDPAFEETAEFFGDAFRGDLGYVVQGVTQLTRMPVTEMLTATFVQSVTLLAVSIGLAAIIGVVAGGIAATRSHSVISLSTLTLTVVGVSVPSFFLALLFQIADIRFYQNTGMGLFPVFGISSHRTASLLPQIVAPALVLAARPLAHITRVTFVSISEILNRDYIRTARAKGLGPNVVYWRHTLRNAGVSIFTAIVVSLRFALGSLPVVEIFFQWPGMGETMLNAINARDSTLVAALALTLGVTFLLVNLLVDILYRFIDPRLRTQNNGGES